ncbi:MAG: methyltransferase [Pseudomonadota bacterium]
MSFLSCSLLPQRVINWRNRQLASEKFQTWAASFRLTRPMAQKKAREIFDICAGFVYSQILFACVELNLFTLLRDREMTAQDIASHTDLPVDGAERLARAAVSLKLLQATSDCASKPTRYFLGEYGAALLGNASVFAMVRHHAALYRDLGDPVGLLRDRHQGTALANYWGYATKTGASADQNTADYSALMAQTQAFISDEILNAINFSVHRRALDVGGGAGAFVHRLARAYPDLDVGVFDLPSVVAQAQHQFDRAGLASQLTIHGGDFLADPLPAGYDLVTLIRVLHDHEDANVETLLSAAWRALPPGGHLLVAEPMAQTPGAQAMGDGYFGFYLWAMGSGKPRSAATLTRLLQAAGFCDVREVATRRPILTRILSARKNNDQQN